MQLIESSMGLMAIANQLEFDFRYLEMDIMALVRALFLVMLKISCSKVVLKIVQYVTSIKFIYSASAMEMSSAIYSPALIYDASFHPVKSFSRIRLEV